MAKDCNEALGLTSEVIDRRRTATVLELTETEVMKYLPTEYKRPYEGPESTRRVDTPGQESPAELWQPERSQANVEFQLLGRIKLALGRLSPLPRR